MKAATEQIVKLDRGFPGGYPSGTVAKWINITTRTPMPSDWAERCSPYTGPIPADILELDAAAALAAAQQGAVLPPPITG
jgi:hypothetical protein